jgi:ubiquinone/menaquinone biosynthesis C-methylase UbiE
LNPEICLSCEIKISNHAKKPLLKSDNFSLFAGSQLLCKGSIIIKPHCLNNTKRPFYSFADLPAELLDEVAYLRGLISKFYRDVLHEESSFCYEFGGAKNRPPPFIASACSYHAHLHCYPGSFSSDFLLSGSLKNDFILSINNLHDLKKITGNNPYFLIQSSFIDTNLSEGHALREKWYGKAVLFYARSQFPARSIHGMLNNQFHGIASTGTRTYSGDVIIDFGKWLGKENTLYIGSNNKLDYVQSVERSNRVSYDDMASDFDSEWKDRLNFTAIGKLLCNLPRRKDKPIKILDVGCGPGHYCKAFNALRLDCWGIDVSDEMVEIARKNHDPEKIEKGSLFKLPYSKNAFDAIWHNSLIVHIPRRSIPEHFSQLHRILRDDGVLFLSAWIGKGSERRRQGRVFFYYSDDELQDFFKKADFKVLEQWIDKIDKSAQGGKREKTWKYFLLQKNRAL